MRPLLPRYNETNISLIAILIPIISTGIATALSEGPDPISNYYVMFCSIIIGGAVLFVNKFSAGKLLAAIFIYAPAMFIASFVVMFMIGCYQGFCI